MKKTLLLLLIASISIGFFPIYAQNTVPLWIRIGLYYNDQYDKVKPSDSTTISADNNLNFYISDDKNYSLITATNFKSLVVSKDVYNNSQNGAYYHLVVGNYISYLDALKAINNYYNLGYEVYPAYILGTYKIIIGNFDSIAKAQQAKAKIYGSEVFQSNTLVRVMDNNKTIFAFDGGTEKFLMIVPTAINGIEKIKVNSKLYRGRIEFKRLKSSDMTVINVTKLEEYLYGIIRMEIDPLWNPEVVKAFAIVARTYALQNLNKHSSMGFDLCPTDDCQVYGGAVDGTYGEKQAISAVDATKGEVITYNGKLISAVYFSSTGGIPTEDSENVWKYPVEYLRSVDNSKETPNSKSQWTFQFSKNELKEKLKVRKIDVGDILDIQILEKTKVGRVLRLKIIGTNGEYEVQKETTRTIFGLYSQAYSIATDSDINTVNEDNSVKRERVSGKYILNEDGVMEQVYNTNINAVDENGQTFEISTIPNTYTFNGFGWGHGVGMSQWGAKGLADKGYTYKQIIKHYYTGVEIEKR
ncbi:SpoIID/LytB domain-containing protein [Caldicellulosiruptoraceae bacterium PP1]